MEHLACGVSHLHSEKEFNLFIMLSRCPSGTLFPFFFWVLPIKTDHQEKGYPFYGVTGELSYYE